MVAVAGGGWPGGERAAPAVPPRGPGSSSVAGKDRAARAALQTVSDTTSTRGAAAHTTHTPATLRVSSGASLGGNQ